MGLRVEVLLATYNGEKFLAQMLDSLVAQSYANFVVLAHDDGSTDGTVEILNQYASNALQGRLEIIDDGVRCGGAKENFAHLISISRGDFVFFADQDDFWRKDKIEIMLSRMHELTADSISKPVLIFSDLVVVDQNLKEISSSFREYENIKISDVSLRVLLNRNIVTGCATLVNRSLLDMAQRVPKGAVLHDWWLALIAACNGAIYPIEDKLVFYRQHDFNDTGATQRGFFASLKRAFFDHSKFLAGVKRVGRITYFQANELASWPSLTSSAKKYILEYICFRDSTLFVRLRSFSNYYPSEWATLVRFLFW